MLSQYAIWISKKRSSPESSVAQVQCEVSVNFRCKSPSRVGNANGESGKDTLDDHV